MPKITYGCGRNVSRVVVSLCDYSGNWPEPWAKAGHTVVCFDLKHGDDVTNVYATERAIHKVCEHVQGFVDVILAAPPCTDFAVSGAQYWPAKDADGRTQASIAVVEACLTLVRIFDPRVFALENPVGRLPKLVPALGKPLFYFQPHEYAGYLWPEGQESIDRERYTKKTGIWGHCTQPAKYNHDPIRVCKQGSWVQKLGGKSERTKELRSMTPMGFATAFHAVNRP